jgi:plastocyanin
MRKRLAMSMTPLRVITLATAIFAIVAGLGMAVAGHAKAAPGAVQVTIKNFDFQPMAVTVPVGGTVTWKNLDGEPHTVTSTDGTFRSGALDEDDAFTFKFTRPGVYSYLCTIHPKMRATVTVR